MNTTTLNSKLVSVLTSKLVPVLTVVLCFSLWFFPVSLANFNTILAALLVLIASYVEYKKGYLKSLGFQKNRATIKNLFVYAPLLALGLFLLYCFVLMPSVSALTGTSVDFSGFDPIKGNLPALMIVLLYSWISAAFGEEIVWRGYFMRQFNKFFGKSRLSLVLNVVIFAALFGMVHSYQGITGQILAGIIGLLLAIIFHLRKYDLWFNIAVHAFFDTLALIALYNEWI